MNLKKLMKRLCSGFMAFALVGTFAPTALAAPPKGVDIYSNHYVIMDGEISATPLDGTACDKFTPADQDVIGTTDDTTIDLWVSSTDMSGDTYQIPYVIDDSGNTWYLQQIVLYNFINDRDASQTLMNADAIVAAKSKEDYILSVEKIEIDPYVTGDPSIPGNSWYDVCYGWTTTAPSEWGGGSSTQKTYTVTYDFNIPEDVNSIFPITEEGIQGNESSGSYDYINKKVAALTSTKVKNQNFAVADGLNTEGDSVWHGFFGYKWDDPDTSYYYFDGWTAEDGSVYKTGATATASSTLAGNDTQIIFTGVWTKVTKLTDEQLAAAKQSVPLDVFTRGDNGDLLIDQSTDTLTKEDNLISYTVSAAVNDDLLLKSNVPFMGKKFATFEIVVNVDPNLEFANQNQDGTVTLQMESKLVVPKTIETTGASSSAWTGDGKNWTVDFDPDQLPSGKNGLEIRIQAEFTGKDYTIVSDVMTLTGLDFKLKEDVFESTGVAPQVNTSANMTAKMDLRNMAGPGGSTGWANTRFRLWVVERLLGKDDANGKAWRTYFGGGVDNPTAYVHALQFLDHKLADYDLSADTLASLKANTVVANGEFTITATADEHGSISPSGTVTVKRDGSQPFTITPNSGYQIADVKVDGTSVGAVASYTFENVTANHTIEATFEKIPNKPTDPPYIPPIDPDEPADPDDTGVSDLLNTEDHIQYLFGYPDGTFGPENNMTRAEVAQMFYNLLLDQDVEITKTFDDVPANAWYTKAVNTLASLDIISGVGDNKFEPERSITRAEFTSMAMKFAVGGEDGENIFSDVDEDDWFYDAVVNSIQYGWIHGYGDGTFRPQNPITRAEVTAIVNNMLGRAADEDFVDEHAEELTPFSDIEKHWAYYHIVEATNDHDYTKPSSGENWTKLN